MSIKDYNMHYIIQNGITNEIIKVPYTHTNEEIYAEMRINELMLMREMMEELENSETIVISKSYMKD